jgi:hypothetical protein
MMILRALVIGFLVTALVGCTSYRRADDAATAKVAMIGMSREDVLACMGPPKKKAHDGDTEVWSYASTDGHGDKSGATLKQTGYSVSTSTHDRNACTVNVVMKNAVVKALHYSGATSSSIFTKDDECGYAIADCLPPQPVEK